MVLCQLQSLFYFILPQSLLKQGHITSLEFQLSSQLCEGAEMGYYLHFIDEKIES